MNTMLAVFGLGGWEVVLILAVVLVLFGAKKLPELAKGLGQGIKEFKKATREVTDEIQSPASVNDSFGSHSVPPPRKIETSEQKVLPETSQPEKTTVPH